MDANPYQPPAEPNVAAEPEVSGDEEVRLAHLKHEASVKGLGTLCLLGGVVSLLALPMLVNTPTGPSPFWIGIMLASSALYLSTWWGFRTLAPWSRIPGTLVAALSLLSFPLGTLIGIYALVMIHGAKGRRVLSADYRQVVARTPHLRYRTPRWLWFLLLAIVAACTGLIVWAMMSGA